MSYIRQYKSVLTVQHRRVMDKNFEHLASKPSFLVLKGKIWKTVENLDFQVLVSFFKGVSRDFFLDQAIMQLFGLSQSYLCFLSLTKLCLRQLWIKNKRCLVQHWVRLSAVRDSVESGWVLYGTALSQAECCTGQRWVRLSAVRDSVESGWVLYGTALSQAECCTGQRWVRPSAVRDSVGSG